MTQQRTDIRPDLFESQSTEGQATSRRRRSRRNGGPPKRPSGSGPTSGFTPLARLVGLVAVGIAATVLLISGIQGCRGDARADTYRTYVDGLAAIAADSHKAGDELSTALTTPGVRLPELQETLTTLVQQQEHLVSRARELPPPGRLRLQHQQAVEALQFRVSGLRRLQVALTEAAAAEEQDGAGMRLAGPMRRLVASDIIWVDQFKEPAIAVLRAQEITGVNVPDSEFLANAELATERALGQLWERIRGAETGAPAGLRGNALLSVRALPSGQVLTRGEENIVHATPDLAFEAIVENSGEAQEVRVGVTLEIDQSERPIKQERSIDIINPGDRKSVRFDELGQIVQFMQRTPVKVEVAAVPGETNLANNSATFDVTFSLTPP